MTLYLTEKQIIAINYKLIIETSPGEQIGVVEPNSLNMTVESPKQEVFGEELYPTLFLKAANLYRNIVMKHIFFNANKRTAFTCLEIFLYINGVSIKVPTEEGIEFTVRIATERLEEEEIAKWIERHIE
ncbi:type II toxin-antitoxin system death-on-curing family toxin [Macrococcoides canis]|uniref:type II toxin-antitoxin system death-on-curing family toxin n=1 Tax=Macrococcoides canis TaxID=1855823 RepID=UPI0020B8F3CD|nr:type II toxin-antitoxin system death-on-curing family toxin [Macrococcus canis]UTH11876.1 type II toxin-antitoxin system death-on-curing family toxin [Macrococcus canis]